MNSLFRTEVIESNRRKLYGEIALWQPITIATYVAIGVVTTTLILAYLAFSQYTTTAAFTGYLQSTESTGISLLPGEHLISLQVRPGAHITAGQAIAIVAGDDLMLEKVIKAPFSGWVSALTIPSAKSSHLLMELTPDSSGVEVILAVPPEAAAVISPGMDAFVRLPATIAQPDMTVSGHVSNILYETAKTTSLADHAVGTYSVRIDLAPQELIRIKNKSRIVAGAPAHIEIVVGRSTLLSRITDPIADRLTPVSKGSSANFPIQ